MEKEKNIRELKVGNRIVLYGIGKNPMQVFKKYFEIRTVPRLYDDGNYYFRCYIVRENGTRIVDKDWNMERIISLIFNKDLHVISTDYCGTLMRFYFDPKIPCEMVIKNLQKEKRKINKKIMDCQYYMYKVEEV